MPYFPEQILPSRFKQESDDVAGNKFVISGQDENRLEDEIRSIEEAIGAHTADPTNQAASPDALTALANALARLVAIRDSLALTTSGVVCVKDSSFPLATGIIAFPPSWSVATLVDPIPEAARTDEAELDSIGTLHLSDVSNMPDEGYVSIINDVSTAFVYVSTDGSLRLFGALNAYGKVGTPFQYPIGILGGGDNITIDIAPTLPAGLFVSGGDIIGSPVATGSGTWSITVSDGTVQRSAMVNYLIASSNTPLITAPSPWTLSASIGQEFTYAVPFSGLPNSLVTFSPPLPGISVLGTSILGTPEVSGAFSLQVTVTDQFGDSSTRALMLSVA